MTEEKVQEKKEKVVSVVDVATQTEKAFKLPNEDVVDLHTYLVWLGNKVVKIEESMK